MITKIRLNPDKKRAEEILKSVKDNNYYCPCALEQNTDTRCMCKNFREEITLGYCHCGLYYKENIEDNK